MSRRPSDESLSDAEAKVYSLRLLAYHLCEAGEANQLHGLLIDYDWLHEKAHHFQGDLAFAADVDAALINFAQIYSDEALVDLYTLKHLLDYRTSLYNDTDLATLVWIGRTDAALDRARLRSVPNDRFQALTEIIQVLIQQHVLPAQFIAELQDTINLISDPAEQAAAYCAFALLQWQQGEYLKAEAILERVKLFLNDARAGEQYAELRVRYVFCRAITGQLDEAALAAANLTDSLYRSEALSALAVGYAEAGELDRARAIFLQSWDSADAIEDPLIRCGVHCDLAIARSKYGESPLPFFSQILEDTNQVDIPGVRIGMISFIASGLATVGETNRAESVLNYIERDTFRDMARAALYRAFAVAGDLKRAAEVVQAIEGVQARADGLRFVAGKSAEKGRLDLAEQYLQEAHQLVQTIGNTNARKRIEALCRVASLLVGPSTVHLAHQLIDTAQTIATQMDKIYGETHLAYSALTMALVRIGELDRAKLLIETTAEQNWVNDLNCDMIVAQAEMDQVKEARAQLPDIRYADKRAATMSAIAQAYVRLGNLDQAHQMVTQALEEEKISEGFRKMVGQMVEEGQVEFGPEIVNKVASARNEIVAALSSLALGWSKNGDIKRTEDCLNQALDLVVGDSAPATDMHALYGLVVVASGTGANDRIQALMDVLQQRISSMTVLEDRDVQRSALAAVLAATGRLETATDLGFSIQNLPQRESALMFLSATWYRAGNTKRALELLEDVNIDDFIHTVASWQPAESLKRSQDNNLQASSLVMRAVKIAAWERIDWRLTSS